MWRDTESKKRERGWDCDHNRERGLSVISWLSRFPPEATVRAVGSRGSWVRPEFQCFHSAVASIARVTPVFKGFPAAGGGEQTWKRCRDIRGTHLCIPVCDFAETQSGGEEGPSEKHPRQKGDTHRHGNLQPRQGTFKPLCFVVLLERLSSSSSAVFSLWTRRNSFLSLPINCCTQQPVVCMSNMLNTPPLSL